MSRARNIKPKFFKNEDLAELPPLTRILFQGLWCEADREGRLEDRPKRIKVEYLPYDDCNCDDMLQQLHDHGFITRYSVSGRKLIQVVNFAKHQKPHQREAPSELPGPDHDEAQPRQCSGIDKAVPSRADSPSLIADSPSLNESSLRSDSCAELDASSTPPAGGYEQDPTPEIPSDTRPPPDTSEVFLSLLTNDRRRWPVTEDYLARQQDRFPAVDVRQQIRAMEAWLEANPRKRKTWAGMKAFVTNWLSRDQNRGGHPRAPPGNRQPGGEPTRNARREL